MEDNGCFIFKCNYNKYAKNHIFILLFICGVDSPFPQLVTFITYLFWGKMTLVGYTIVPVSLIERTDNFGTLFTKQIIGFS